MKHLARRLLPWIAAVAPLLSAPDLSAQGRNGYLNVESPQVSPIAHVELATPNGVRRILAVCNTPDNSLELWDTDETLAPAQRFLGRCWVGLEPVSVLVNGNRFWTANFLGDSVTAGVIELPNGTPTARVLATERVGDEPADMTLLDHNGTETLVVSLHSRSAIAWLDASSLARYAGTPADEIRIAESLATAQQTGDGARRGLKEPRAVRRIGDRVYALGMKGGVTDSLFDVDMLVGSVVPHPSGVGETFDWQERLGGLGSTNYTMRTSTADDLYVVGGEAQNLTAINLVGIQAANSGNQPDATGFVRSTLYRVHRAGGSPSGALTVDRRDLNHDANGQVIGNLDERVAQPTDIAVLEANGNVIKLFVAAMGSDAVVVLARPAGGSADIATWTRRVMRFGPALPGGPQAPAQRFGPRSLVLGASQSGGARLYVLNRIDHSIIVIDARNEIVLDHLPLANDPTPAHVKAGRHWLYDAQLSSSHFVSCAGCHPDGRTDALSWRLSDVEGVGMAPAPTPHDELLKLAGTGSFPDVFDQGPGATNPGVFSSPLHFVMTWWTQTWDGARPTGTPYVDDKREMVTQTLQGLSNWEVDPSAAPLFSNAPYHWRGDRQTVQDFDEGFVNLLGSAPLSDADKAEMEEFVLSLSYPPNPKQDRTRTYPTGTLAAEGLELFHTRPSSLRNRSCSTCHELPEGSNNRLTVFVVDQEEDGFVASGNQQSIESGQLRGLFQREPVWQDGGEDQMAADSIRIGHWGLNHNGLQPTTGVVPDATDPVGNLTTINTFLDLFFTTTNDPEGLAIKQFVHEMDWGVAPIIGHVEHVTQAEWPNYASPPPLAIDAFLTMISQVHEANAGMVLWLDLGGQGSGTPVNRRGFRYFPDGSFLEEPSGAAITLQQIHGLLQHPTDAITALAVPLGSERRAASPTGTVSWPQQSITLPVDGLELHANSAYEQVPTFPGPGAVAPNTLAAPNGDPVALSSLLPTVFGVPNVQVGEVYAETIRRYQQALLDAPDSFGLTGLRHEAPRRIRVRGNQIQPGAKLLIEVPDPEQAPTDNPWTTPRITLALELYPTVEVESGQRVWETAAELDPLQVSQWLLGGSTAPGVQEAIIDTIVTEYQLPTIEALATQIAPLLGLNTFPSYPNPGAVPFETIWNVYPVRVRNPGPGGPADPSGPESPREWRTLRLDS